MILIRTHFIFISLTRFCIWHTVLELTIELVCIFDTIKRAKASGSFHCCFARRKNLISVSSFACWNCPLPQTCLPCACTHCRLVFNGVLFLYSLLNLSASLPSIERRRRSGSLHCCLLLEKSVSVSSSSIERQVASFVGKIGTRGIIIRSLEPLSVASNLISVWVPVCALSTLVHYRRSGVTSLLNCVI